LRPFSLCRHARATTPAGSLLGSGCSPGGNDGGLPQMSAGSAPALTVSRPARRSLAFGPTCSRGRLATLSIEGFGRFVTSATAPIATGWSNTCQVGIAPTEERHLGTAHGHSEFFFCKHNSRFSLSLVSRLCGGGGRPCRVHTWRACTNEGRLSRRVWIVARPIAVRPRIREESRLQRKWSCQWLTRGL